MRTYKRYTLLWILVLFSSMLRAQEISDVTQNEVFKINHYVKNIIPSQPYSKSEVEMVYSFFKTNTSWMTAFNKSSEELCRNYLSNESKYELVLQDVKAILEVKNQIQSSRYSRYEQSNYTYRDATLESIHNTVIGKWGNTIFVELKLLFSLTNSHEEKIPLAYYYLVNTKTNEWKNWNMTLDNITSESSRNTIWTELTSSYIQSSGKYDFSNKDYQDSTDLVLAKKNVLSLLQRNLNPKEMLILPFAWGIMARVPDYAPCSKFNQGEALQVFIPYVNLSVDGQERQALHFLQPLLQVSTPLRNFYEYQQFKTKNEILFNPTIELILKENNPKRIPKSCTITRYQRILDTLRNFTIKEIFDFNGKLQLLHKQSLDSKNKVLSNSYYSYDAFGNATEEERSEQKESMKKIQFIRDANNNVIRVKHLQENEHDLYYFYNQLIYFQLQGSGNSHLDRWNVTMHTKQDGQDQLITQLNAERTLKGEETGAYRNDGYQMGLDTQGHPVEAYSGDEQRCNFLLRNEFGWVTSHLKYYLDELIEEQLFLYSKQSELPTQIKVVKRQYGSETLLEYDIEWEYFQ